MLESTYCIIICLATAFFLIAFSFLVYQYATMDILVNEVAAELSQTYSYGGIESEEITSNEVGNTTLYRYLPFRQEKMYNKSKQEITQRLSGRLTSRSLEQQESGPIINVEAERDGIGRYHYKVSAEQKYNLLLKEFLDFVPVENMDTISSTSYSTGTDVLHYVNSVKMAKYLGQKMKDKTDTADAILECAKNSLEFIKTMMN